MAKPTAPTEFGGTKTMFAVDPTAVTPLVYGAAAVQRTTTAEATYPASWWGFATHRDGDTVDQPGGFTGLATAFGPVVLVAGKDGTTVRGIAVNAGGAVGIYDGGNSITVDGSVSITGALPAGTNNIGDVDVLTVPAPLSTTGGGTEATALRVTLANDSTGLVSVDDNGSSLTVDAPVGTPVNVQVGDGTNTATIRNLASNDALNVAIVDASGNQVTSFGGSGGTSATDDSAFTPASGSGTPIMGFADEITPDSVDEGDVGVVRMTLTRALHTNLRNASGTEIGTSGAPVRVDPTGTTTQPIHFQGSNTLVDAPTGGGEAGIIALAVRNDNGGSTFVSGTGEFSYIAVDANGRVGISDLTGSITVDAPLATPVHVQLSNGTTVATIRDLASNDALNVAIVDGSGNQITSFGGSGGTSATDDGVFTAGSGLGTPMMGFATSDLVDSGDVGVVGMTTARGLYVNLRDDAGDSCMDGVNNAIRANIVAGFTTQYTEDAAAPANPVGTAVALVRADTPATLVSTDGDIVAQRATNYGAAYVQIVSSSGSFVDSFGGGTQYTEGDTDPSITGTAMLMEGAGNALVAAQGTAADGLLVNLGSNNDVTVTGTVTATPGTGAFACNTAIASAAVSVTTSATALPGSALSNRRRVVIQNLHTASIFVGGSGVTTSNGVEIFTQWSQAFEVGPSVGLFGIVATGTADVRVLELS